MKICFHHCRSSLSLLFSMTDMPRFSSRKSRLCYPKIICRSCCREEVHFMSWGRSWLLSVLSVLSLGLIYVFGPFRCSCCGKGRLFRFDWLRRHPLQETLKDRFVRRRSTPSSHQWPREPWTTSVWKTLFSVLTFRWLGKRSKSRQRRRRDG